MKCGKHNTLNRKTTLPIDYLTSLIMATKKAYALKITNGERQPFVLMISLGSKAANNQDRSQTQKLFISFKIYRHIS